MSTKIYKIGGAFLKTAEDIKKLPAIIEKANIKDNKGNKLLLIVSAFQKITSQLSFAGTVAEHDGAEAGLMLVDEIINFHLKIVEELFVSTPDYDVVKRYVLDQKLRLENLIRGINLTNELSPQSKDTLLSIGEMLASRIVTGFLKKYYNHILLFNSADVFITDNSYGAAVPDIQETEIAIKDALIPLFKHVNLIVAQGFIGSTKSSDVTTMGMESSNLTATIYAGVLGADELVFWTDTEGIRQYDPKYATKKHYPRLLEQISFQYANLLSNNGLKLIHPDMIKYLKQYNLEAIYKSGHLPDGRSTRILFKSSDKHPFWIVTRDVNIYGLVLDQCMFDFDIRKSINEVFSKLYGKDQMHYEDQLIISADDLLFITKNTVPVSLEYELGIRGIFKTCDGFCLTIGNFKNENLIGYLSMIQPIFQKKIQHIFLDQKNRVAKLVVEEDEDALNELLEKLQIWSSLF